MKKEILTNECLTNARTLYRKLKHLHQVHWTLGRVYNKKSYQWCMVAAHYCNCSLP
jgi:hypothetical protein